MPHDAIERVIAGIERIAAAFLAAVTVLMFVSVLLRYFLAWAIPDSHDLGCLMLGILIFWGMAGAGYRGEHITVDLIWTLCPPGLRRLIDLLADTVTVAAVGTFTWMMGTKVISTRLDGVETYDTQMPVWIFYLVAWIGLAAAAVLTGLRAARIVVSPRLDGVPQPVAE